MPEVGIEPTRLTAADFKSTTATNYVTRANIIKELSRSLIEATVRIELTHRDFADLRITTFLRGLVSHCEPY